MNMNNFEEGTECIKNKKVSLTFFFCVLIYLVWDQREAKREMSIKKQSCLRFYIIVSLGEAADHEQTCRINLAMAVSCVNSTETTNSFHMQLSD